MRRVNWWLAGVQARSRSRSRPSRTRSSANSSSNWSSQPGPTTKLGSWLIELTICTMFGSIVLGFRAIRRRDIAHHRAWIMRGYAIGLGAGTRVLTHLPWMLVFGGPDELTRAFLMLAGWVINLAFVEWLLRRRPRTGQPLTAAYASAESRRGDCRAHA